MSAPGNIPKWVQEFRAKYSSGVAHVFLLHFNTADYVDASNPLKSYLAKLLASREIVAFYNRSEGITFPLPAMQEQFMTELQLGEQQDDALAALQAVQGRGVGNQKFQLPREPNAALSLLERLLKLGDVSEKKSAVIIDFLETLAPNGVFSMLSSEDRTSIITLQRWARDINIMQSGNPVILITQNLSDVHTALRAASSKIEALMLPLPDKQERLAYIDFLLDRSEGNLKMSMEKEQLTNMTAGLAKIHIEDIKLRAEQSSSPITYELVKERKESIIRSEFDEVIEIMEPEMDFSMIGGLEQIKEFFRKSVIRPLKTGNKTRCPMGVLLTGPPGTGKTAIVQAIAKEADVNCVSLNLAKILGQYVGASERNLEKALRCIEALNPTLVFIDEIDQSMSRGASGDSGVSNRLFKRLLEFMSDTSHRGEVVFLAASNRPDLMDAALKRPGRFDKKIPFFPPEQAEREAIFSTMFRKYSIEHDISDFSLGSQKTEGYTGAEIEGIVIKAFEVAQDRGSEIVQQQDLDHALESISKSTESMEFMVYLAIKECNDKDLLPEKYRQLLDDRKGLEEKLKAASPEVAPVRRQREL